MPRPHLRIGRILALLGALTCFLLAGVFALYGIIKVARSQETKKPVTVMIGDYSQTVAEIPMLSALAIPSRYLLIDKKAPNHAALSKPMLLKRTKMGGDQVVFYEAAEVEKASSTADWHLTAKSYEGLRTSLLGSDANAEKNSAFSFSMMGILLFLAITFLLGSRKKKA